MRAAIATPRRRREARSEPYNAMTTLAPLAVSRLLLLRRALRLEYLTVGWNIAEGLIAVGAEDPP